MRTTEVREAGSGKREAGLLAAGSEPEASVPGSPFAIPSSPSIERCRDDFPILATRLRGGDTPLVYLDNAATTQKPQVVIDATSRFYAEENANIHRGVHWLSEQATIAYDRVREQARAFLGAAHTHEIIFTRGTSEALALSSSIPSPSKSGVSTISPAISPQTPTQRPCACPASIVIFNRRTMAGCVGS